MKEYQSIQEHFDKLQIEVATLSSHYMKMEKKPKWFFWIIGAEKDEVLWGIKYAIQNTNQQLDEARHKLIKARNHGDCV